VAGQETRIDRVVDDLDPPGLDAKEFLNFVFRERRDGKNPGRISQHSSCELKMQRTSQSRAVAGTVHVVKKVMHGDHIRTRKMMRPPE